MYPNLHFFLKDLFNIEPWGFTKYVNSFGFLVAIAFVVAAFILRSELMRKEKLGLLKPADEKMMIGEPASKLELFLHFIFGFIIGYKLTGIFFNGDQINPQDYIFSKEGNIYGGLLLASLFTYTKYREKKKLELAKPTLKTFKVWPHERVGDITVIAAITGFLGAKIFDNLENWDRFIQNPIGNLLSPSGLTFYGGLILATISILVFARKKGISIRHLVDSAAPALMIAYAIGRMGCHISGDGDWGVFNSAYTVNEDNKIVLAADSSFRQTLINNPDYTDQLVREYNGSINNIPYAYFKGSSLLPNWFWAYNYPHNVNEIGVQIAGCKGNYCTQLNPPVFPTTLYEISAGTILFLVLWFRRKQITAPGRIFGLYLFLNGMERFLIEKIRVNTTYSIWGFHPTQAELISSFLMLVGILIWIRTKSPKTILNA
jgi:prolipoprotein diacylglyceryltransferase